MISSLLGFVFAILKLNSRFLHTVLDPPATDLLSLGVVGVSCSTTTATPLRLLLLLIHSSKSISQSTRAGETSQHICVSVVCTVCILVQHHEGLASRCWGGQMSLALSAPPLHHSYVLEPRRCSGPLRGFPPSLELKSAATNQTASAAC